MLRRVMLGTLATGFVGLTVGCGDSTPPPRNDAPIKTSEGVDQKGNKTKTMEASGR